MVLISIPSHPRHNETCATYRIPFAEAAGGGEQDIPLVQQISCPKKCTRKLKLCILWIFQKSGNKRGGSIQFPPVACVTDERQSFLKFLRIEVSEGSGGFLSSGSPSGSNSPND